MLGKHKVSNDFVFVNMFVSFYQTLLKLFDMIVIFIAGNVYKGCYSGEIQNGTIVIDNIPTVPPPLATDTPTPTPEVTTEAPLTLPPEEDLCENVTVCANETVCTNGTNCVNETICRNETVCQDPYCTVWVDESYVMGSNVTGNISMSVNGTQNGTVGTEVASVLMYGMVINGSCVIDADGTPCSVVNSTDQVNVTRHGVMINGSCLLDGSSCEIEFRLGVNGTYVLLKSGGILNGICIQDGTPCITDDGYPGKMMTGYCDMIPESTTAEVSLGTTAPLPLPSGPLLNF